MRNIWTIAHREYKLYFISPMAYAIFFTVMVALGIIFGLSLLQANQASFYGGYVPDIQIVTGPMVFLLLLSTPALTMRLLAEEQRLGTMELLLTAPVRDWELVVGKWLGAYLFILTVTASTLIFPLILNQVISPGIDQGMMVAGYVGLILVSAAFLGIGVGISAAFSNQLAAFFTTLVTLIVLWYLVNAPASLIPAGTNFLNYIDMQGHFYNSMYRGIINLSDIVYYLSLTALGLFAGSIAVEIRRWH
jgi:ABC-2 type transport system permease protein